MPISNKIICPIIHLPRMRQAVKLALELPSDSKAKGLGKDMHHHHITHKESRKEELAFCSCMGSFIGSIMRSPIYIASHDAPSATFMVMPRQQGTEVTTLLLPVVN